MIKKYSLLVLITWLCACTDASKAPEFSDSELRPGGEATLKRVNTRTFIHPSGNLSIDHELEFWDGLSFFRDPWVASPAITADRDGLGPLYNARSCKACHSRGGRGRLVTEGVSSPMALLFRLGHGEQQRPDPIYGAQLQTFAVLTPTNSPKLQAEGQVELQYEFIEGQFADGTRYQLRKPSYRIVNLSQGELHQETQISPRYAPAIYGMGLLDAIDTQDLLSLEDEFDSNNDGISGRYNRVPDVLTGEMSVGRFGFKGLHPTLNQQIAGAFVNDIGITNPYFRKETCQSTQLACLAEAKRVKGEEQPEIPTKLLQTTEFMSAQLAVQPTRNLKSAEAQSGRETFYQLGCHLCHQPSFKTRVDYSLPELAGQVIWPYTDLALHDMGEELADGKREHLANGREWRTAPLWGIGLQHRIQGYQAYLHDGRARTINEAILWHGGEAKTSQEKYLAISASEREALLFFLTQI
ncbi:di-heme oxidoredictase family protein [Pseudoalteromonas ulvae]|uniref:Thiol oxidoreductase n=1 Tax=Pseudoalteromonas ulvae TaxID=107327 RepID=A0A244CQK6_PSEDV|nr:di-heme oxidoredictase family protein [Pseudoalteromonas ulvae]OUL57858.1 hypothetical protein B1199_12455 [Pseudoalteromonas ulvae]